LSTLKLCHTKSRLINHHFPYSDIHQNQNTQNTPKAGYPISETPIFYHLTAYPTVNVYINSPFVHHLPRQNLWVFHRVLYVLGYSLYHFFPHFQETHLPRRARWWATCSTPWRVWCTRRSPSWHHERWSVNWTRMEVARVLQWIDFLGTFLTGTPHIEWENLWFPVKISLKPIHVWVCYKHFPVVIS
jgi:hypothetical protein